MLNRIRAGQLGRYANCTLGAHRFTPSTTGQEQDPGQGIIGLRHCLPCYPSTAIVTEVTAQSGATCSLTGCTGMPPLMFLVLRERLQPTGFRPDREALD